MVNFDQAKEPPHLVLNWPGFRDKLSLSDRYTELASVMSMWRIKVKI